MAHSTSYDVTVVGAGIMGMWTAYTMVKRGLKVLLLDQFHLPHSRGSSGCASRIFRYFTGQDSMMAMLKEAHESWKELELLAGEELMKATGSVEIYEGSDSKALLKTILDVMRRAGLPHDVLTFTEMKQKFPMFQRLLLSDGAECLYDPNGSVLFPVLCSRVLLTEFLKHGGTLRENERVTKVIPGETVRIITLNGHYLSDKIVLTTAAWTNELLATTGIKLPLQIMPAVPCYWREHTYGSHSGKNGTPIFGQVLQINGRSQSFYGIPSLEYPGMMRIATRGDFAQPEISPDARDSDRKRKEDVIEQLKQYTSKYLPEIDSSEPAIVEQCIYTFTPDSNFIIDRHPKYPNILIGTGGSGHGYRAAPVIGKLLTEMTTGATLSFDITPFRINRFSGISKL